ncbi:MAG: DUF481 domain-containing protein [SAR86 cluster bacterium]|jgi:putative salt-induced outer membrane protein
MQLIRAMMLALMLVGTLSSAIAEDAEAWTSEVEVGFVATSGNTDEQTLKLRADSQGDFAHTRHHFHLDSLQSSNNGSVTAQKFYGFYQADYKLDEISAVFGRISHYDDRFSGFKYQSDLTSGYSRLLLDTGAMTLTGDVGVGLRVSELDSGHKSEEGIVRLAAKYAWEVSENAAFQQLLSSEIGSESTIYRSDSSIKATINGSLSMKVALTVKYNSVVPVDRDKMDTETSVTLVYGF